MYRENGCMSIHTKTSNKCTERMVVWVYIQKLVNKCTERMVVWVYIQKLVNKCT